MILIQKLDELTRVAISTTDMVSEPSEMVISSVQKKDAITLKVANTRTGERCGIYQFFAVGSDAGYNNTIAQLPQSNQDEYKENGHTTYDSVTYINSFVFKNIPVILGSYNYKIGSEVGLFQVGIPQLKKTEYQNSINNTIYYEG